MTEAMGRVGRWLRNKWHLDSLIAIGGMAAVYASTHRNGARAAIKMLHSQYTRNEQARRRFLAEGYAANKVGHRNAVLVLDDDTTEDGEVYLVMELLDGESLEGRLERVGVMGPMEVLELADQLLEVLACAHPKGILHRDIKPANIYLTRDGSVKLLDFGLARVRELSAEAMDQSDGIVFGTVSYIAPEQARADNQNLDARSDMWSIAATMFRALSGETVHPSTGPIIDRLLAVARKPPRSIASVVPNLPRPVVELVDRALAFEPENRWPSANVMRVVVQDVMAQLREEAEAQAESDAEVQTPVVFARRTNTLPPPVRSRAELPTVRSGSGPLLAPDEQSPRPKTDPVALSGRPRNLPITPPESVPSASESEAGADAARTRRSRTLLTKEGRAELRRILDARKAQAEVQSGEPSPTPAAPSLAASESGAGDVDVDVDDSIIEVTIDHTHRGRPGPIAEPLADPPAPRVASGSFPAVGAAAVPEDRSARTLAPPPTLGAKTSTGSFQPVGAPPRTSTPPGGAPQVSEEAPRRPITEPSPVAAPARRPITEPSPVAAPARRPITEPSPVAAPAGPGLDDRRVTAAPSVPEDSRHAPATASYPSLGGPSSRPIQAARPGSRSEEITRVGPAPVSGEINTGTTRSSDVTKVGPAPVSGEINTGTTRGSEVTRVGPAPVSGEINSGTMRGAGKLSATDPGARPADPEITRVGPPPPPPAPSSVPRPGAPARASTGTLHDTLRPKTIPPVSPRAVVAEPARSPGTPARPAAPGEAGRSATPRAEVDAARTAQRPVSEPVQGGARPVSEPVRSAGARPVSEPPRPGEAAASESGVRMRAGLFTAPPARGSGPSPSARAAEPAPQRGPETLPQRGPNAHEAARGPATPSGLPSQRGAVRAPETTRMPFRPVTPVNEPARTSRPSQEGAPAGRSTIDPSRPSAKGEAARVDQTVKVEANRAAPMAEVARPTEANKASEVAARPGEPAKAGSKPASEVAARPTSETRPESKPGSARFEANKPAASQPKVESKAVEAAKVESKAVEPAKEAAKESKAVEAAKESKAEAAKESKAVEAAKVESKAEAAKESKAEAAKVESKAVEPAVPSEPAGPRPRSMFNPYPSLGGTQEKTGSRPVATPAPVTAPVQPEAVPKDSEAAARASAPTAPQPVVPADATEAPARPKAAAPVLPFSFLRPGEPKKKS